MALSTDRQGDQGESAFSDSLFSELSLHQVTNPMIVYAWTILVTLSMGPNTCWALQ